MTQYCILSGGQTLHPPHQRTCTPPAVPRAVAFEGNQTIAAVVVKPRQTPREVTPMGELNTGVNLAREGIAIRNLRHRGPAMYVDRKYSNSSKNIEMVVT